ncbi:SDR family NAD(P)-dependent oxidoreductase [Rhodococcoides kyotonense]|uniref:NAD(P)-dependent dehydrogenase, short-chain alcohol dehydrogenase family n=1 Tax=Rhodococcoides kyotonense TaxID=398843 RepID=A0A239M086_9NOCA|nr:SDR family NAD(P)-dependent oxidoreductase [Rhodococcus kyotonensis]SNT36166.1 NAD(P)-dependent dehydrogenase, short-chain alcohol dehydrogenase family [Rhodococcus kyotonensis]
MSDAVGLTVPELPRNNRLRGRTAIVTGAGSHGELAGTGAAMAILFALEGAKVVIVDVDGDRANHTLRAVQALGGVAEVSITDITDIQGAQRVAELAMDKFGSVDVLINNAAIAPDESKRSDELWRRVIDINLRGAQLMCDAVIPHMTRGGRGSIVMIGSIAGLRGGAGVAYSAAKAGMIGMAKSLAFTHGRSGIRVNTVAPGHVAIPMGLGYSGGGWDNAVNARHTRAQAGLSGTEGTAWDVAYTALFFATDESKYVTASTVAVDAGTTEVMPIVMLPYLSSTPDSTAG